MAHHQNSLSASRREFIAGLGGAAAVWPLAAGAQQGGRMRRLSWLIAGATSDRTQQAGRAALQEALAKLGWIEGRNLRTDLRWGNDFNQLDEDATELAGLAPDVVVTSGGVATRLMRQRMQNVPIVFTSGGDVAVSGLVRNVARPEANITGFSGREPSIASKWMELLKDAAPHVTRVAVVVNPELTLSATNYLSIIEAAVSALGIQAVNTPIHNTIDIVRAIDAFAAIPNSGLLILPPAVTAALETIVQLAAQHRLPAIYPNKEHAAAGGLMAYASDLVDQHRRAAAYIDRILRGAKVSELPVQFPTKYELVVNLKTAKAIGLTIPEAFLLRADELIE